MSDTQPSDLNVRRTERLVYVEERLFWTGRVNGADLMVRFGISKGQASADLARYRGMQSAPVLYDPKERAFVAPEGMKAVLTRPDMDGLMNLMRSDPMTADDVMDLGFLTPVSRRVDLAIARSVVRAIIGRRSLAVTYYSLSSGRRDKVLSPHALATDGMRFHARAYDHDRQRFADFVLGRMAGATDAGPSHADPDGDTAWFEIEHLALVPNPAFPDGKRRAVEMDYGMKGGKLVYPVRHAMLLYADARLLLHSSFSEMPPVNRPIVPEDQAAYDALVAAATGAG
ncbi:WYL domain-containing protein [Caenispirillum salinarum]|uniref:WYL domain-containing protein n=1 Tax=Caenispirillum salinarum TaxID=859058 RepID=UPI00384BFA18